MRLAAGSRLGPYEVLSELGAGGMGEVYKARDTRLGRTVAIKVINPGLALDPSFRARFDSEARTLSRISHPNICLLLDVGDVGGAAYLVLEHLEGESLAERLTRGPLPFDEARRIGIEICRALHTAHRAGIVHRDLKPANVMLTKAGAKLLDFGLAREHTDAAVADVTTAVAMTQAGTIIGTVPYMAPEQIEGCTADTRSDVFALGAVLFEAISGRRAFAGETPMAIAAAVLAATPPALSSPAGDVPPALDFIVQGCLARDPEARWQSAHDVGRQLEAVRAAPALSAAGEVTASSRSWWPWALTAVAAAAAAIGIWTLPRSVVPSDQATITFQVPMPPGTRQLSSVEGNSLAVSPDGSQLAWVGVDGDGSRIWLRPIAQLASQPLAGTEGASALFWSPDSRSIGFFAKGLLQRLDLPATTPVIVCSLQSERTEASGSSGIGYSGTWGLDGQILFAPVQGEAIFRVSTSGGSPQRLIPANRGAGEQRVRWPWFLPDGRTALYQLTLTSGESWLMLLRPGQPPQRVEQIESEAQYAGPGYVVFVRDGTLVARRFDAGSGRLSGDPASIAAHVESFPPTGWGAFAASRSGTVAVASGHDQARLTWINPVRLTAEGFGAPGDYLNIGVSSDEDSVLVSRNDGSGTYDIWSIDLARGTETRVTSGRSTKIYPIVTPDRRWMIYSRTKAGSPELTRRDLASGAEEILAPRGGFQEGTSITRDGRTLIYSERRDRGDWDVLALPLDREHTARALAATSFNELDGRLSADDGLIAFASDETNDFEVYVAPFPAGIPKRRVSTNGGHAPRWNPNGRDLFYLGGDGQPMSVPVTLEGTTVKIGTPTPVLPRPAVRWKDFLPMRDGRLLAIVPEAAGREQPMTVIAHALK